MVARSTVSFSSCDSLTRNGRAADTKSAPTDIASRWIVGPSRTRPVGDAAITNFSASSAATMRCTVERARLTRCAICPRLSPDAWFSSARRIAAARPITCIWFFWIWFFPLGRRFSMRDNASVSQSGTP